MAKARKLRITVDESSAAKIKGIGPLPIGPTLTAKVVELPADKVKRELRRALTTMKEIVEGAVVEAQGYELDEVSFSLRFDASGQVSLLSIAGGSVSASSGVQFKFRRRHD